MGWARMDDGFDDHPKVLAILDEDDTAAAGVAIGLWALCLTWAHRNTRRKGKTPGLLPAGLPRRFFGGMGKDGAELLVKHRLWEPQDDGGWLIHDFGDYLPTEETRAARAEAGRRGAAKRWGSREPSEGVANERQDDGNLPSGSHDPDSAPEANDGSRVRARRAISKEIAPTPEPVPEPEELQELFPPPAVEAKPQAPDRFDEFYSIYPRKKDPRDARKAWDQAIKARADPEDVIAGARQYRAERAGKDPQYTAYPASWLRAEGWRSEPDLPPPKTSGNRLRGQNTRDGSIDWADPALKEFG